MDLIQLVYVSHPFGYDGPMLNGILLDARRCNARDGITGALVCRQDIFLQFLEGPEKQVNATFARIARDDRHLEARQLLNRKASGRLFGEWAMLHDPAKSWIWSAAEVADGVLDRATEAEIVGVFETLAARARDAPFEM